VPLKVLLGPYPVDAMICWPVSPRVGNVKNNDASLIDPVTAAVITPAPCRVEHDEAVDARHLAARLRRSRRPADLCRPRRHRHQAGGVGAAVANLAAARHGRDAARGTAAAHQPFRIAARPEPRSLGAARASSPKSNF